MTNVQAIVEALARNEITIAFAESLTGGMVASHVIDVPGASRVVRGGVVAYATDVKATVLEVDEDLLEQRGPVDPDVAMQMAQGVRALLGADCGLATTGVAGPDSQDGHEPGEAYVAVILNDVQKVASFRFSGERSEIRLAVREEAMKLLAECLEEFTGEQIRGILL